MIALSSAALLAVALQVGSPRTIDVAVVDERGAPVAGAEVRWFDGFDSRLTLDAIDDRAHASGNVATTDDTGHASLTVSWWTSTLVASAGERWGTTVHQGQGADDTVHLLPDRAIAVSVVDRAGKPLGGIRVGLRRDTILGDTSLESVDVVAAISDVSSGRAVLGHAGYARATASRLNPGPNTRFNWQVVADTTPTPMARVNLQPDGLPEELRLVVGDLGEVEVEFVGAPGEQRLHGCRAFLLPCKATGVFAGWTSSELETLRAGRAPLPSGVSSALIEHGAVVFPAVCPGSPVLVAAFRNEPSAPTVQVIQGPTDSGERVRVRVSLGGDKPPLSARIMVDGIPLRSSRLAVGSWIDREPEDETPLDVESGLGMETIETDPKGVLRIDLPGEGIGFGRFCFRTSADIVPTREAWVVPGRGPDLGDIELETPPLAVGGIVIDEHRSPIAGAEVAIRLGGLMGSIFDLRTDAAGMFAFHTGWHEAVDARFRASGFLEERFDAVRRHTPDLRIVLRRPADVRGYLRVPPERAIRDFTILMLRTEGGVAPELAPGTWIGCACDGLFEFKGIKSGEYLLRVRERDAKGRTRDLLDRPGIAVHGGETLDLGEIRID